MTTAERVMKIVANQLGFIPGAVTPEKRLVADLGADSLDQIETIMYLEDEFGIEIVDEEAEACATVADLITLVEKSAT